jgi:hypothetical protein
VAVKVEQLVRELRAFDDRRAVVQAMRRGLRKPAREITAKIRAHAIATLPKSGGLGAWTAASKITNLIRYAGRTAGFQENDQGQG